MKPTQQRKPDTWVMIDELTMNYRAAQKESARPLSASLSLIIGIFLLLILLVVSAMLMQPKSETEPTPAIPVFHIPAPKSADDGPIAPQVKEGPQFGVYSDDGCMNFDTLELTPESEADPLCAGGTRYTV